MTNITDEHGRVIRRLKAEADHLIKDFRRGEESSRAMRASERLLQHPRLARFGSPEGLWVRHQDEVRRKHALDVVAIELGRPSWGALMAEVPRDKGERRAS